VQRRRIVLRIDGDRLDAEVGGRTGDPDGDLAPVGDQQALQARAPCEEVRMCIAGIIGSAQTAS
jgi:hypothetical protein